MALPDTFCWSRIGTESGEELGDIISRKEQERAGNNGIFLWGIGSAIGPSVLELARVDPQPQVLFSPIRSVPKSIDVHPARIAVWLSAQALTGDHYDIPARSVVTSRFPGGERQACHYALVCQSTRPLQFDEQGDLIEFHRLRNLRSNRPVGASQVTAIVRLLDSGGFTEGVKYRAVVRATLVFPYLVRLQNPIEVPLELRHSTFNADDWGVELLRLAHQNERERRRSLG
jgi:hypothetical protein